MTCEEEMDGIYRKKLSRLFLQCIGVGIKYLYGVMGRVKTKPSSKIATHFSLSRTFAAR